MSFARFFSGLLKRSNISLDSLSVNNEEDAETQANIIRDAVAKGAIGLKVYKSLGLTDKDLSLIHI